MSSRFSSFVIANLVAVLWLVTVPAASQAPQAQSSPTSLVSVVGPAEAAGQVAVAQEGCPSDDPAVFHLCGLARAKAFSAFFTCT